MDYYRITAILHSGIDGERNTPRTDGRYPLRVNRIVEFDEKEIVIGYPFCLNYVTDANGNNYRGYRKRTSYIVDWDYIFENKIRIETYRTIYEFEKIEKGKNMKLIFQNSHGEERIIAEPANKKEIVDKINKFLDDHNFKSYYTRVWEEDDRLKFDVGSHTEFFYVDGMTFEEWRKEK